jgi:hypothetical protein
VFGIARKQVHGVEELVDNGLQRIDRTRRATRQIHD